MAAYDAISLAEAKEGLRVEGTGEDEQLQRLVTGLTLELESRLGTQFVQRSVVEYHPGGTRQLFLQRTPIQSVTTILDPASHAVAATDYVIRRKRWLEHFGTFPTAYAVSGQLTDWTVTYVAGWFASTAAVTADVKEQMLRVVGSVKSGSASAASSGILSTKVGDLAVTYAGTAQAGGWTMSPAVDGAVESLMAYRGVYL